MPDVAGAVLNPDQRALERSDGAHGPDADEARVFGIVAAAFDLHRQPEHLQKQDSYKNDQVAIAAEYRFHNISFKFRVAGFARADRKILSSSKFEVWSQSVCPKLET